jgi:para-nitrobenzyl esterase
MGGSLIGTDDEGQGEDCLRLNVWAPIDDTDTKLPVMVWIHGGAYLYGSGSSSGNHGHTFARDGVVFVSLNYRLGALGFLHTGSVLADREPGSGNYGIADQVAALRWVRDNITGFGGDPDNVTVLGVSAGGNYTQSLTACPQADGLFRRAISQSAGGPTLWGIPAYVAAQVAAAYFEHLGVGAPAAVDLSSLTVAQLLDAQASLLEALRLGKYEDRFADQTIPFYPVSGTDHQPRSVLEAHDAGATAHVDMIIGSNRHEMALFKLLAELGGPASVAPRVSERPAWQDRVRAVYRETEPEASDERIKWTVDSDRAFRIPNLRATEGRVRNGARTWWYEFAWESPAFDGRLGASHGLEMPFVFDDTSSPIGQFLLGGAAPAHLAKTMHETWINFARTGVPSSAVMPEWPVYNLDERPVAVFAEDIRVEGDRDAERRASWDGVDLRHSFPLEH